VTINVASVLKRRDRLRDLFRQYWNCTFDVSDVERLVPILQKLLPGAGHDALFETLRHFTGRELLRPELDKLAWLIAGGNARLKAGLPVTEWVSQVSDEWVPVHVMRVFPGQDQYGNHGYQLSAVVLSGTPSGKIFHVLRRPTFLAAMSRKIGFTRRNGPLPYLSGYQYMSLRFMVQLSAAKSQYDLVFDAVAGNAGTNTWNKRLLRLRHRLEPCPQGYTHQCHRCVVGSDICPAATHRLGYIQQSCSGCGEQAAWFDPELPPDICVECAKRKAWNS
jgi:hypothetical protein